MHRILGPLVMLLLLSSGAMAQRDGNWAGRWDATWSGGEARLELVQTGNQVIGSIPLHGGQLRGRVDGAVLSGDWSEDGGSGQFAFRLSPDGQSFSGGFDNGAWWTGARAQAAGRLPAMDQSTPRAALRSFLMAGDLGRAGVPDAIGRAAMVMEFGGTSAGMTIMQQVQLAQRLFDLVDLTTVNLWRVPEASYDDSVAVTLQQSGTSATLPLRLHRLRGGLWWVVAPDPAAIGEARTALLARFGGRLPSRSADNALPTPRDTMRQFVEGLADWNGPGRGWILDTLDLRALPDATRGSEGALAALSIAEVLQRVGPIITQVVPDDPAGRNAYVHFVHPAGRIAIDPVDEGGHTRWKFTDDTIQTARDLYAAMASAPVAANAALPIPRTLFFQLREAVAATAPGLLNRVGALGLEYWQVLACLAVLAFGMLLGWLAAAALHLLPQGIRAQLLALPYGLGWPIRLTAVAACWQAMTPALGLPHGVLGVTGGISAVMLAVGLVWGGWQLIDLIGHRLVGTEHGAEALSDEIVLPLAIGVVRVLLVGAALVYVANALSIPYGGLIAGLGISGLAIAFASKETLSNIFGAAILVIDRPFRRGDMISAGDTKGTVEHVGIRSTRIRTAEDSVIVLPNGKLSDATINNLGTRRHRLTTATLVLPYSMTPETVAAFVDAVASLVAASPGVVPGRTDVSVTALTSGGVQMELTCYVLAESGSQEKAARQALMLDIIRLGDRMGVPVGPGHTPRLPEPAPVALAAE